MALPVRSPPPSLAFPSDSQTSSCTAAINASEQNASHPHPHFPSQSQPTSRYGSTQTPPKTPTNNNSVTMGILPGSIPGAYPSSSPLTSPGSSIDTPPSAWLGKKTSSAPQSVAQVEPVSPSVQKAPSSNTNGKANTKANRKGTSKAKTATNSKKRPAEHPPTKAASNRVKKQKKQTTPPPPSSRPARVRKAPARLIDAPTTTAASAPCASAAATNRVYSKVWDPYYCTTNPKSRLTKTDLYHLLLEPEAWNCLTVVQHKRIMSLLPRSYSTHSSASATPIPRPSIFSPNSNLFRTDVAKYHEELTYGHLTKAWQASAMEAVVERNEGQFDWWKAQEAERWWGQKG